MWGTKLKNLLKDKGYTQKQLSEALGIPESSFSVWINSSYPPLEFIEQICGFLHLPLWRFFAPDDLVIPEMLPEEKEVIRLFQLFPDEIKKRFVDVNIHIAELLQKTIETIRKKK